MPEPDHKSVVRGEVFEERTFLGLTLSKRLRDDDTPWSKVTVRPVLVRGRRALQFAYFDGKKGITQNFFGAEAAAELDEVLALPFGQLHVRATSGDLQVLISRKGQVHLSKSRPTYHDEAPVLDHDHQKHQPLPASGRDPFLKAARIVNKSGKIRAAMRGKYNQVNEFLRIIDQVVDDAAREEPVRIADCGCGSAHLTFAAFHYLNHVRGVAARVEGVDTNEELIAKCVGLRDRLGWEGLDFRVCSIAGFRPDRPPEVVLSLHACDTATDEALAQGVRWGSRVILAAPCCQHELHHRLEAEPLRALVRHGILRERLADIVTDAFRALALRIMGYRTDVIEFVDAESTAKNLMIRAVFGPRPGDAAPVREYNDLKAFWEVTPALEEMLGAGFRQALSG